MKKIGVLYVYPSTYLAPSWTVCATVIRGLDQKRFAAYAVLDETAKDPKIGPEHATVYRYGIGCMLKQARRGNAISAGKLAVAIRRIVRDIREQGIDIVHCTDDFPSLSLGLLLARVSRTKLLINYHTIPTMYSGARLAVARQCARAADLNVAVSRFVAKDIVSLGIDSKKVAFVMNGADPDVFRPGIDGGMIRAEYGIPTSAVLALQLARIWQPKRQEDFVKALAIARRSDPSLYGLIVGWEDPRYFGAYGSYKEELIQIARSEGVLDALTIAPARPEATQLHASADIFVLPSVNEPCALVLFEAMATGKPVIGARSGGTPEIIVDGESGLLVAPRAPEELAAALLLLARDQELRSRLGQAARLRIKEHLTEAHVAPGYASVYEALVKGKAIPEEATAN